MVGDCLAAEKFEWLEYSKFASLFNLEFLGILIYTPCFSSLLLLSLWAGEGMIATTVYYTSEGIGGFSPLIYPVLMGLPLRSDCWAFSLFI